MMEGNTNNTNEDIQSIIYIVDDASDEDLSLLNNQRYLMEQDEADIKTSEHVSEVADVVSEGNWTVRRTLRAAENAVPSSSNLTSHNITIMSSSGIEDMDPVTTSTNVQPYIPPPINQTQSQINVTSTDNSQQQSETEKHIMISYNRATATTICQKIYDRLTEKGYKVWFDRKNLTYGSIIDAMGEAIDDASVVLLFLNEGYSKSNYCLKEAKYATETKVPVIPCMVEENFRPRGGLGIIKSDQKHIEFFGEDKFDESFEELTTQINAIAARSNTRSVIVDTTDFRGRFNAILREHMLSIQNCYFRRRNLDGTELCTVLRRLIQEFSPEAWQSFQNDPSNGVRDGQIQEEDNDRLLRHLFVNNERLAELVRIQQENHARIEQHLTDQDERLAAFQRFQQREEQERLRLGSNERLISHAHVGEMEQGQERNGSIVGQLQQHIGALTELVINQQQQHARDMEAMHQLVSHSLEASSNVQQQRTSHFDPNIFRDLIQIIVLLCTLLVLLKDS